MDIVSIILLILTVAIPAIFILLSVLFGFKRNIYQSLAKLGMTVFAIGLSVLLVKLITPAAFSPIFNLVAGSIGNVAAIIVPELTNFLSVYIMPAVFFGVFSIISLICLILYLTISKKKLTDAKVAALKAKIAAKKAAKDASVEDEGMVVETVEAPQNNETPALKDNEKAKKAWLRVGCVALSVLSVLLVLAHFAMPLSYYSDVADDVLSVSFMRESTEEILPIVDTVSNYPAVKIYRFVSTPAVWCFDRIRSTNGVGDSARNTLDTILNIADIFSNMDKQQSQSECFYAAANLVEKNPYLDNLLLEILQKVAFDRTLLGQQGDTLGGVSVETVISCLERVDSAKSLFYMLGDIATLPDIIGEDITDEALTNVFVNFRTESLNILEVLVLESVKDMEKFSVDVSDDLVSSVFTAITEIKNDPSISDDEKAIILADEAESIQIFLSVMNNPRKADPKQIGKAIAQSNAISDALIAATDGGTVRDPCGFGKALTSSFTKKVNAAVEAEGIAEDSELYAAVNAFFSKK